jgi:hypothetical protein
MGLVRVSGTDIDDATQVLGEIRDCLVDQRPSLVRGDA